MLTCRDIAEFLMQYRDRELPWPRRAIFNLHLAFCRSCRAYMRSYDITVEIARLSMTPESNPAPADVPEELIRAILASRAKPS